MILVCSFIKGKVSENILNIIFLDVDGVINSINNLIKVYNETHKAHHGYSYPFDQNCMENLKELVTITNSKLVISSTWRKSEKGMTRLLEELKKYDLDKLVIGTTPILGMNKGEEIKAYLEDYNLKDDISFVILDDNIVIEELIPHLIYTNRQIGLTKEDMKKAITILKKTHIKEKEDFER